MTVVPCLVVLLLLLYGQQVWNISPWSASSMKCLGLHFSDICALGTFLLVAHRLWQVPVWNMQVKLGLVLCVLSSGISVSKEMFFLFTNFPHTQIDKTQGIPRQKLCMADISQAKTKCIPQLSSVFINAVSAAQCSVKG